MEIYRRWQRLNQRKRTILLISLIEWHSKDHLHSNGRACEEVEVPSSSISCAVWTQQPLARMYLVLVYRAEKEIIARNADSLIRFISTIKEQQSKAKVLL